MDSKTISFGILRAFFIIAAIVLGVYFINIIFPVIMYLVLALIITLVGRPFVLFLRDRLKFGNTIAVVVTMVIMLLAFTGFISMFIPLILKQSHSLSLLNIERLRGNFQNMYIDFTSFFSDKHIDIEKQLEKAQFFQDIDFDFIPTFINSLIGFLGSFTIGLFSVLFISFFLLKDAKLVERLIMGLAPKHQKRHYKKSMNSLKNLLSRYFIGLGIQISILFVIYTITLLIFGVDNAVVIAFLCALLNLIPYLGPLISFGLMMVLTMISNIGQDFTGYVLPTAFYVMIGFIIGQLIDNFFSQPFIFSNSVKSHPLEIFLVIIIAGLLSGPLGMVFCIPAYTAIKVILKEFYPQNRFVKLLTKNL